MPVHGEVRHLVANAELAVKTGVPADRVLIAEDGVVIDLVDGVARIAGMVECGYVYVDGASVGEITEVDLKDRRILGEEGFISIVVVVDSGTGKIVAGPDIHARGFAEDDAVFDKVRPRIVDALATSAADGVGDVHQLQQVTPPGGGSLGERELPPSSDDPAARRRGVTSAGPGRSAGVTCAGGAVLDRHLHLLAPAVAATSNPARAASSPGGVARNVAENLALLGVPVRLCSRVGDDDAGRELAARLAGCGVDVSAVAVAAGRATAQYVAVLDPGGELVLGIAAMDVLDGIGACDLATAWPPPGDWLFLDCNLSSEVLTGALRRADADGTPLAVDAVSTPKVTRLVNARAGGPERRIDGVRVLFCNLDEARALLAALSGTPRQSRPQPSTASGPTASSSPADSCRPVESCSPAELALALVGRGAAGVVVTLGAAGVVIADPQGVRSLPARPATVVDVTGAGDALVAGTLSGLVAGAVLADAVRIGIAAAAFTVAGPASVRADLQQLLSREPSEEP